MEISMKAKILKLRNGLFSRHFFFQDLEPSITPPTVIDDPADKKPETWDEREKIDDPNVKKPDDW